MSPHCISVSTGLGKVGVWDVFIIANYPTTLPLCSSLLLVGFQAINMQEAITKWETT